MKIGFVVNPKAGVKKSAYQEVSEWAQKYLTGHEVAIHATEHRGHATELARQFVLDKFDAVVCAGGDGTANETAQGVVGSNSAFTIIPYGSGNGLARGLHIPLNREKALKAIPLGKTKQIDVGKILDGGRESLFFGFAGIGYDAHVGKLFNERNGRRGFLSYVILSVNSYRSFTPALVDLYINEEVHSVRPFILAIANTNEYGNGAIIAPHAIPDDGYFDVCLIQDVTFAKGILHGWRLFNGSIDRIKETTIWRTEKLVIKPKAKICYHLDGETRETAQTLEFSIMPGCLKVLIP